jgi:hypothetical protein
MISYDHRDQSDYYTERSYYLSVMAGVEPVRIDANNADAIKGPLNLALTGAALVRAKHEIANILLFSETLGYLE